MDAQLTELVRKYAMTMVSQKRYEHSLRTAEMAGRLCEIHGLNPEKGYFAGIAHDICKEMKADLVLSLARLDGKPVEKLEQDKPSLLHGRAAASVLKKDFLVADEDVLEAVGLHTFGAPQMGDLAKVLYVADKIKPGRPQVTEEYLERIYAMNLDEALYFVLKENIDFLKAKGKKIAPASLKLLSFLEG
ncbi:MAG: bis(5'-nucleosyl)-tetraphosphatase (symmetrical) YqeK [Spirochaetaceae bacterium]|nr:bis(5'-nucleosyl)-tetraphosphatase (symmetrical) YqeK [Spirochaetaceae bacterium]